VCRLQFSSKERDPATGWRDYGFRYYAPQWQRWLSADPIGEAGGVNLYGFVGNAPVDTFDPHGLQFTGSSGWPQNPNQQGNSGNECHERFANCMSTYCIGAAALDGVGGIPGLLGVSLGLWQTASQKGPMGGPRPLIRSGKLTGFGKSLVVGGLGGLGLAGAAGAIAHVTACVAELAGCLSGQSSSSASSVPTALPPDVYPPPIIGFPGHSVR
jgi:RHS repeat-associated protein